MRLLPIRGLLSLIFAAGQFGMCAQAEAPRVIQAWSFYSTPPFVVDERSNAGLCKDLIDQLNRRLAGEYEIQLNMVPRARVNRLLESGATGVVLFAPSMTFGGISGSSPYSWSIPLMRDRQTVISLKPPQGRQAVFIGDLIDRGPEQIKVIETVRAMIDAGNARAVMGNHEFNAIGYVTPNFDDPHKFLRPHTPSKVAQHREFLDQVGEGSERHRELVTWFRSLPVALDLGSIRVVHAWWHQDYVDEIAGSVGSDGFMSDDFLQRAFCKGTAECKAMEGLTKGLEVKLSDGHSYFDHQGEARRDLRCRWWHESQRTIRDVAIVPRHATASIPASPLPEDYLGSPATGSPIFIGHYWMDGIPAPHLPRVACVDYSAAGSGPLVAYRWTGESTLSRAGFITSTD